MNRERVGGRRGARLAAALALGLAALFAAPARGQTVEHPGRALFVAQCARCHGVDGSGAGVTELERPARSFRDGGFSFGNTVEAIARTVRAGIPGTPMPAFGEAFADDELLALAEYVRLLGPEIRAVSDAETVMTVARRRLVARGKLPPIADGAPVRPRGLLVGDVHGFTYEYRVDDVRLLGVRQGGFVRRTDWEGRGGSALEPLGHVVWLNEGGDPGPLFALRRREGEALVDVPLAARLVSTDTVAPGDPPLWDTITAATTRAARSHWSAPLAPLPPPWRVRAALHVAGERDVTVAALSDGLLPVSTSVGSGWRRWLVVERSDAHDRVVMTPPWGRAGQETFDDGTRRWWIEPRGDGGAVATAVEAQRGRIAWSDSAAGVTGLLGWDHWSHDVHIAVTTILVPAWSPAARETLAAEVARIEPPNPIADAASPGQPAAAPSAAPRADRAPRGAPRGTEDEDDYYTVEHYEPPAGAVLEVGGMAWLPDGRLAVSTRRGQVWIVDDPLADDIRDARFHLYAEGLQEGLGLAVRTAPAVPELGVLHVLQRGELTRLFDMDGNGTADAFDTVCDAWGLTDNYHEFAFGLPDAPGGGFYIGLNVGFLDDTWWLGRSMAPYRGWVARIDADGGFHPIAPGFRSPCGLGTDANGELFVTDNQGDWMPACPVFHVRPGRFHGHPASLDWTAEHRANAAQASLVTPPATPRAPAALWLPYKWSRSPGNLVPAPADGSFGPFANQLVIAELTNGMVLRAQLEQVRGEYQGACWPLRQRIGSVARVLFAPDGTLLCGMTNRGWGGRPPGDGLARVRWTGTAPMEMQRVRLLDDGFAIRFTKPLAPDVTLGPDDVDLIQYDYDSWWEYGSPERHTTRLAATAVEPSPDRREVVVRTAGLRPAMVARLRLANVVADDGTPLLHDELAYTINQMPSGPATTEHVAKVVPPPPPKLTGREGWLRLTYGDAFDAWTSSGWELVDASLDLDDPTRLDLWEGVGALVGAAGTASDFTGRYELGDGLYRVDFMLPEGGAAVFYVQGRYGIHLADDAAASGLPCGALTPGPAEPAGGADADGASPAPAARPPDARAGGTRADAGGGGRVVLAPASDAYQGPGQWHVLEAHFEAPRFDDVGQRVAPGKLVRVSIDGVALHEEVALPGPDAGAPLADGESPLGPIVVRPLSGQVALRTFEFRSTSQPAAEDGWVAIFNGSDLDGWTLSPDAPPPGDEVAEEPVHLGGWYVDGGELVGTGGPSHLFSPRGDYTDVELRAQVKISDDGNSGMYVRTTHGPGWPAGYEAQVNASNADPVRTGSVYGLADVHVQLVPPDTWFTQQITCRDTPDGTAITVRLDGVVVAAFLDAERRHPSGHVALQQHHDGSVVRYRDVEVRDLTR